jgi:hypothetical protein
VVGDGEQGRVAETHHRRRKDILLQSSDAGASRAVGRGGPNDGDVVDVCRALTPILFHFPPRCSCAAACVVLHISLTGEIAAPWCWGTSAFAAFQRVFRDFTD